MIWIIISVYIQKKILTIASRNVDEAKHFSAKDEQFH